jgi:hypothetical protein
VSSIRHSTLARQAVDLTRFQHLAIRAPFGNSTEKWKAVSEIICAKPRHTFARL